MIGEKQNSEPSLGEWKQKEHKRSPKVLSQDGHGVMGFLFRIFSSRVVLTGVRSHVVATTVCATGDEHTLTCCTHTFFWCKYTARTLRIFLCVLHTNAGSRVSAVGMSSSLCHLIFSLLMFHPSLLLLFLDGHFETTPDLDDLADFDVHAILPNFPNLKSAGQAHTARGRAV